MMPTKRKIIFNNILTKIRLLFINKISDNEYVFFAKFKKYHICFDKIEDCVYYHYGYTVTNKKKNYNFLLDYDLFAHSIFCIVRYITFKFLKRKNIEMFIINMGYKHSSSLSFLYVQYFQGYKNLISLTVKEIDNKMYYICYNKQKYNRDDVEKYLQKIIK